MDFFIKKHSLKGSIRLPTSKSQTLRALIFALLAKGESTIINPLASPDTECMIHAIGVLGAHVKKEGNKLYVTGTGGVLSTQSGTIDTGGSGIVYRFITALLSISKGAHTLTDQTLGVSNRVITPLLKALVLAGNKVVFLKENNRPPFQVHGAPLSNEYEADGSDSQTISALLIGAAFRKEPITIKVNNPNEIPWLKITVEWLIRMGIEVSHHANFSWFKVERKEEIAPFTYTVPADYSSLMYPVGMALVSNSNIVIDHIDLSDSQGDKIIIEKLKEMGAKLIVDKEKKQIKVLKSSWLLGIDIDMSECIDAISFFAVMGCFAKKGVMRLFNAHIARKKECDRIKSTYTELKKMGANIQEKEDGLIIYPSTLKPSTLKCYGDHRMVLSFSVAAFALPKESHLISTSCINKTYALFANDMNAIGANIKVE